MVGCELEPYHPMYGDVNMSQRDKVEDFSNLSKDCLVQLVHALKGNGKDWSSFDKSELVDIVEHIYRMLEEAHSDE